MTENAVSRIVSKLNYIDGENFFRSILTAISKEIGSDHLFVAEVDPEHTTAVSIAHVQDGNLSDNFSYELLNTPCAKVIENKPCFFKDSIQSKFPEDFLLVAMDIEGYVGAPLINSEGKVHGIIVALFKNRQEETNSVVALFDLFSGMISSELERSLSKKRLQINELVFNVLDEGVIVTNNHKQIVYVNPAFCRIYGYSKEEVIGNDPGNLLRSGKQDNIFYESMWDTINKEGSWAGKIINKKKCGENFSEWLKINKAVDPKSGAIFYIGVFHELIRNEH